MVEGKELWWKWRVYIIPALTSQFFSNQSKKNWLVALR